MIDSSQELKSAVKYKIAGINNILAKKVFPEEISQLSHVLESKTVFNDGETNRLVSKYIANDLSSKSKRLVPERLNRFQCLNFRLNSENSKSAFISYGLYIPTYKEELEVQKQKIKNINEYYHYNSLLIGAYSPETIIEYFATVDSVFPNADKKVIDLEGVDTKKFSGFQIMDGLQTSFKNNSLDPIHTNYLLHMLVDNDSNNLFIQSSPRKKFKKLFTEMYRILKPNGRAIMVEGNLNEAYKTDKIDEIIEYLSETFEEIGYKELNISHPKWFCDPISIEKFLRSSSGYNEVLKRSKPDKSALKIIAVK